MSKVAITNKEVPVILECDVKKPNIVFIFADQLCYSALGCNGNQTVKTPNIDSLAEQGIV